MKNAFLSSAAYLLLTYGAVAADLPAEPIPPAPLPVSTWDGLYIGAHAGWGWGNRDGCMDYLDLFGDCGNGIIGDAPFDYDQDGFLIGAQLGYNHMFSQRWLIGAEVDAAWTDIDGEEAGLVGAIAGGNTGKGEYNWLATAKLRLGYAFGENLDWLLYGVAGGAITQFEWQESGGCEFEQTRSGWLLGGGGEWKVSSRASIKAEYNYIDYQEESDSCTSFAILPAWTESEAHHHIVKVGFNWNFYQP